MAASIAVEVETGTCADVRVRHNGYFAGDFAQPLATTASSTHRPAHGTLTASPRSISTRGLHRI